MKQKGPDNCYEKEGIVRSRLVCGVDEVGRGCLAGPVVAAAVVLHSPRRHAGIVDSKLLRDEGLVAGYNWIVRHAWYGVGVVSVRAIDRINIYHATIEAMKRAVMQLSAQLGRPPDQILIDAVPVKFPLDVEVVSFIKGEQRSISIAAASIVAKVTRDRLMAHMASQLPAYHFEQHKGYGTVKHRMALDQRGVSWAHRAAFVDERLIVGNSEYHLQERFI